MLASVRGKRTKERLKLIGEQRTNNVVTKAHLCQALPFCSDLVWN
jgi:hypothetical protein